jgi:hypothetical protein
MVGFILCSRELRPGVRAARRRPVLLETRLGRAVLTERLRGRRRIALLEGVETHRADAAFCFRLDERHGGPSRFDAKLAAKRDPRASVEGRLLLPVSCDPPARSRLEDLVARAEDL